MATKEFETTRFNNIVKPKEDEGNKTNPNPNNIDYSMFGFKGDEALELQPLPFQAFGKVSRITSSQLSVNIREAFETVFHELRGVNILYGPDAKGINRFSVEFFFQHKDPKDAPVPEGKISNLIPIAEAGRLNRNLYDMAQVVQNRKGGVTYALNNETRLILSRFMFGGASANQPNSNKWNTTTNNDNRSVVHEIHTPVQSPFMYRGSRLEEVYLRVTGLDLRLILQALYGHYMVVKTISGDDNHDINTKALAFYDVSYAGVAVDGSMILNINQIDKGAVETITLAENPKARFNNTLVMY